MSNTPDDSGATPEETENSEGFDPAGETVASEPVASETVASEAKVDEGTGKIPPVELPDSSAGAEAPDDEGEGTIVFGSPSDDSGEHPIVVDASTSAEPRIEREPSELEQAYECLEIRTPAQEFEAYSRARLETLVRLGETDKAEVTAAALALGLRALRGVMGSLPGEAS